MPSWKKIITSGSVAILSNVTASSYTGSFTGSLNGTSSWAVSSSRAISSSYALNALSSSYALSASYAPGGAAFPYVGSAEITGSLTVSGSIIVQDGATGIVSTGTTNATEAFKVQNAIPEVLFNIKDDGGLEVNTSKYPGSGVLENNNGIIQQIIGWNGTININQPAPNPPISIFVQNGVITNVI
jgi:hypothetical protein